MLPWYLLDLERVNTEDRALERLAAASPWLISYEWAIQSGVLILKFELRSHNEDFDLRLEYPQLYPELPPAVFPENETRRLSGHQYGGADGPLCLEYGPDNWNAALTAADMVESAFRLLELEQPRNQVQGPTVEAPSRHALELGQELRNDMWRWLLQEDLQRVLSGYETPSHGSLTFSVRLSGASMGAFIHELRGPSDERWTDATIPKSLFRRFLGGWFKIEGPLLPVIKKTADMTALSPSIAEWLQEDDGNARGALIQDRDGRLAFFLVFSDGDVIECAPVISRLDSSHARQPEASRFIDRRIGIVGCGSVGSKVAVALARMGARRFLIVDYDVFLPENVARHAADWRNVIQHKADAVKQILEAIASDVEVATSEIHLTGQESNAVVNKTIARLSQCDILVDATADSRTFNLIAGLCKRAGIPMIWMQVFAGGLGGLVGRSRPGIDPEPQTIRATYDAYCTLNEPPEWLVAAREYAAAPDDGDVVVAADSEVSIIAHHAARFVSDALSADNSIFPYSLYLIGLKTGWVFHAPFATIPIDVTEQLRPSPSDPKSSTEGAKFVLSLLKDKDDPSSAS